MNKPTDTLGKPHAQATRHFEMPKTWHGKLFVWRFLIARRVVQLSILLLFFGTAHWGWTLLKQPLLSGNLSASSVLGEIPLADTFAVLQIFVSRHLPMMEAIIGAVIVLALYILLGGRIFCAWICPVNIVTDTAFWLREKLKIKSLFIVPPRTRYWVLGVSLVLSFIFGAAAFEWISPIAILHRELIFGIGIGMMAVVGVFIFDLLIMARGWCGHLCPLGAFWSIVGRVGQIRVAFDNASCTRCGDCVKVCPEPIVLNFNENASVGRVRAGECTNCGQCVVVCREKSLTFKPRFWVKKKSSPDKAHLSS